MLFLAPMSREDQRHRNLFSSQLLEILGCRRVTRRRHDLVVDPIALANFARDDSEVIRILADNDDRRPNDFFLGRPELAGWPSCHMKSTASCTYLSAHHAAIQPVSVCATALGSIGLRANPYCGFPPEKGIPREGRTGSPRSGTCELGGVDDDEVLAFDALERPQLVVVPVVVGGSRYEPVGAVVGNDHPVALEGPKNDASLLRER